MSTVLTVAASLLAIVIALPLSVLIVEIAAGLLPSPKRPDTGGGTPSTAVLIPAHDEARGIGGTLSALTHIMPAGTRAVVIADNCSDDTATMARATGAEVIERHDPDRRGKGYALAYGRDYLGANGPPEVVIVLDADCRLSSGSIEALSRAAAARGAPVQAVNLIAPDPAAAPMVQIASFAMVVKNLFRSRGMQRLGGAALLTGTGMAFPWPVFAKAELATGSIVEDLALGIELTRAGRIPVLVESAQVRSAPAAMQDALQQKRRWEHGFLETLRRRAFPLVGGALRRGTWRELLLGLHLLVPPLALLMVLTVIGLVVLTGLATFGASAVPVLVVAIGLAVAIALLGVAWALGGRAFLTPRALIRAPVYVLWKLPIYASFLVKPQATWNRTPRRP